MPQTRVLVVDDEPNVAQAIQIGLERMGYAVNTASTGQEALGACDIGAIDVMLLDVRMTPLDGLEVLSRVKKSHPEIVVIMITAHADVKAAVKAIQLGAFDYILKPSSADELSENIKRAIAFRNLATENKELKRQLRAKHKFDSIIGNSPSMQKVFSMMESVVEKDSTVLIVGATGTGKELVARALHYNGPRGDRRLYCLHCAAIPEHLFESELFGHEKGAFTGADSRKIGAFEAVDGGTFFLDEVGETPPPIQAKLLRVLQEREIVRVGSTTPIKVNVRLIAATNRDLTAEVEKGNFREDLYYRLNVVEIRLPLLKERKDDIPLLVQHLLEKYGSEAGPAKISDDAMIFLKAHDWPGNVRELENVIERAVILSKGGEILPSHLPRMGAPPPPGDEGPTVDLSRSLAEARDEFERQYVAGLLRETKGNISAAAKRAGIAWQNFQRKLKKFNMNAKDFG
ncbi:MAG: sigma-54 dependent transcriptional regulator [Planctomycetota bacterium]